MLNDQKRRLNSAEGDVKKLQAQREAAIKEVDETQRSLTRKATQRGQLQSQQDLFRRRLDERDNKIRSMAQSMSLPGYEEARALRDEEVTRFMRHLDSRIHEAERALTEAKQSGREREAEVNGRIQRIQSEKVTKEELKKTKRQTKQDNIRKMSELLNEANRLSNQQQELDSKRMMLSQQQEDLDRAKQSLDAIDGENKIRDLESERSQVELKVQQFKDELTTLSHQADTRAKLSLKKADQTRKTNGMRDL